MKQKIKILCLFLVMCLSMTMFCGCLDEEFWAEEDDVWNENWWEHPGKNYNTADDSYYEYEEDFEWWDFLDDSWSREDWEDLDDGMWGILDEENDTAYAYDEESQMFTAMDLETEELFYLDYDSGEWVPFEE